MKKKEWALITGASEGIGLELSKLCVTDRYNVILVARDKTKLQKAKDMLHQLNPDTEIKVIAADLSVPLQGTKIYEAVQKEQLIVQVLINNAGFGIAGRIDTVKTELLLNELSVNIVTLTELTSLFVKDMVSRKDGRILNVASMAAFVPGPLMSVYYASKAYVLSFSQALSYELRNTGVTVTTLCPGTTKTGFESRAHLGNAFLFKGRLMDPAVVAKIGFQGMKRGRRVVIAGVYNAVVISIMKYIPLQVLLPIVERLHKV